MIVALELIAAFALIVGGAVAFTNAVEWLGHRLDLGAGAVGALLAAVGTALPESVIPIIAVLSGGGHEAVEIAIGAIIGAPFMLATIAMLLVSVSAFAFRGRRDQGQRVVVDAATTRRDLAFFLVLFPLGVALGVIGVPLGWRIAAAIALVAGYGVYAWRTVKETGGAGDDDEPRRCSSTPARTTRPTGCRSRRSSSCPWRPSSAARSCSSARSRRSPTRSASR